jgi:calcineurin-like phosphoesterase family protein
MTVYVIGDHHFGHEKILLPEYDNRDYPDIETHDNDLVQQWNWKVSPNDTVIHFGDLSFLDPEATIHLCRMLHGKIILINGNHDHRTRKFWEERAGIAKWFKRPVHLPEGVWLTHAVNWHGWDQQENGFRFIPPKWARPKILIGKKTVESNIVEVGEDELVIHGHNHKGSKQYSNCINVCANLWEYTPVNIDELTAYTFVENKNFKIKAIKKWATQWV